MGFGQDSDGNRWTTSRWQGIETTTVWPRCSGDRMVRIEISVEVFEAIARTLPARQRRL